jgi:hypothetical protein
MTPLRVTGLNWKPDADEATLILQDATGCLGLAFVIPMNEANRRVCSGSVALAVRTGAPIYASAAAMHHACRVGEAHDHPCPASPPGTESSAVARWLQNLRPEDFGPAAATP